jgi:hypothetical protein
MGFQVQAVTSRANHMRASISINRMGLRRHASGTVRRAEAVPVAGKARNYPASGGFGKKSPAMSRAISR